MPGSISLSGNTEYETETEILKMVTPEVILHSIHYPLMICYSYGSSLVCHFFCLDCSNRVPTLAMDEATSEVTN